MNVQASLWRSIAVFRVASLVYAAVLIVVDRADYKHLGWAWAVLAGMAALATALGYCSSAVDASAAAVTTRSAASSGRVRRAGTA